MKVLRRIVILLILFASVSCVTTAASAAFYSGTCSNGLTWTLDTATGELSFGKELSYTPDYSSSDHPPWYDYRAQIKTVNLGGVDPGDYAFYNCNALESVTHDGQALQYIGVYAFGKCTSLKSVVCCLYGTSIFRSAFSGCSGLEWICLPSNTDVEASAFYNCTSLKTVYYCGTETEWTNTVSSGISSTGNSALTNASRTYCDHYAVYQHSASVLDKNGLLTLLGNGTADPYDWMMIAPDKVKSVFIGSGITGFADSAPFSSFSNCESFTVAEGNSSFIDSGGVLIDRRGPLTLLAYPPAKTNISYSVNNEITAIADYAFANCTKLYEVNFSGSAPAIGQRSFSGDTLTIYYPADGTGWSSVINKNYGGKAVTWKTSRISHVENHGSDYQPWDGSTTTLSDGSYYLVADITLNKALTVEGTVNLCLNGNVLRYSNSSAKNPVIYVSHDASLTIFDCDRSTEHRFSVDANGLWQLNEASGMMVINGGCITGGTGYVPYSGTVGGGIYVSSRGSLTMNGGAVVGNSAGSGGGIMLDGYYSSATSYSKASATLGNNVTICGNTASLSGGTGGGVDCYVSSLTVNGAQICENSSYQGGGIGVVGPLSTFTMNGGRICDNKAAGWGGGGIYTEGRSEITLSDCTITGNSGDHGGGIYVYTSSSTGSGGINVYISGNCQIYDNINPNSKALNNVYLLMGQYLNIKENGLAETARIGITKSDSNGRPVVTSGNGSQYTARFFSDADSFHIAANSDGEAILQAHQLEIDSITTEPTCTHTGTANMICFVCGYQTEQTLSKLPHVFDRQIATDTYIASPATCTAKAAYYYSCECGEKGTETFTSGGLLPHDSVTDYGTSPDYFHTGLTDGCHCSVCTAVLTKQKVIPSLGQQIVSQEIVPDDDGNYTVTIPAEITLLLAGYSGNGRMLQYSILNTAVVNDKTEITISFRLPLGAAHVKLFFLYNGYRPIGQARQFI